MKVKYLWWTVRYGGKKNIPPRLIFNEIAKNMDELSVNLSKTMKNFPTDISENEKKKFFELFQEVGVLGDEINKAKHKDTNKE